MTESPPPPPREWMLSFIFVPLFLVILGAVGLAVYFLRLTRRCEHWQKVCILNCVVCGVYMPRMGNEGELCNSLNRWLPSSFIILSLYVCSGHKDHPGGGVQPAS